MQQQASNGIGKDVAEANGADVVPLPQLVEQTEQSQFQEHINPQPREHNKSASGHQEAPTMHLSPMDAQLDQTKVRLKQNNIDHSRLHQAKKSGASNRTTGSNMSLKMEQSASERRLRNTSNQFNHLADRLLGAINKGHTDVSDAMREAGGYNIVTSKSSKVLTLPKQESKKASSSRFIAEQQTNLDSQRNRVKDSVKNIIQREQARDEQLASRLKKINEKQAQRIKQIESQEKRNQANELHKLVQRTYSFNELKPSQSHKMLNPIQASGGDEAKKQSIPMAASKDNFQTIIGAVDNHLTKSSHNLNEREHISSQQRQIMAEYIPQIDGSNSQSKQFFSTRKEYFNSKHQSSNNTRVNATLSTSHIRKDSTSLTGRRNNEDSTGNNTISMLRPIGHHNTTDQTIQSTWGGTVKGGPSGLTRDRADVSFLQEKATMLVTQNAAKKITLDSQHNMMLSQSQLTSGDQGRDDYLQVALGLRQIGKSIMDMPKTLEDLRLLSREYMKNMGVQDDMQDEQVYLQYIEDHLKSQEKQTAMGETRDQHSALSPIRNLADFYQRKLNKIQGANESFYPTASKSPQRRSRKTNNCTYVDIDQMTVMDLENLAKSPPTINPRRKNMKVVNNKAMTQFGAEAFNIGEPRLAQKSESMTRLASHKHSVVQSPRDNGSKPTPAFPAQHVLTPNNKAKRSKVKETTGLSKKEEKSVDKRKLLNSLNDKTDQLTKPSITSEAEKPQWLQQNLKDEAARMGLSQSNLGKPSSRQDAILLSKWFKDIIDMVETEYQNSKQYYDKKNPKKIFPTQKSHDNEISQTDCYLLIQISHNIAIKEITRQVSVQCIERGILLKTVFDSYVRMVDLIFQDSTAQRKLLAQKFATVCEKQVFYQSEQITSKDRVIDAKDRQIGELRRELELAEQRETALKITNKKLTGISHRNQMKAEEQQRISLALERQVQYLESRLAKILETLEPDKAAVFKKETRRAMHKIQTQADIDHDQAINSKNQAQANGNLVNSDLAAIAGEIIRTVNVATDMDDHQNYLIEMNGGPLHYELQMQTSLYHDDASNSGFDLYDVGAVQDQGTAVDQEWRRNTRPKRIRPKSCAEDTQSAAVQRKNRVFGKRLKFYEDCSYDTSSHHTIDYLVSEKSCKTYTFGTGRRYPHLKRQKPIKRSLSHNNFNWNILVRRLDKRFEAEAKLEEAKNSGDALTKLIEVLGRDLLAQIKEENLELYEQLMAHIENKRGEFSYEFCRELLATYDINLEEERKLQRLKHGNLFKIGPDHGSFNLNDSNEVSHGEDLNLTNLSDMLKNASGSHAKNGTRATQAGKKKKDNMYQFVEWNFQKRSGKNKKERMRKDHPCFPIVTKLLEKMKAGKEIKDLMPVKSAVRYIYNIYMVKAAEFAQEKQGSKKPAAANVVKQDRSLSPDTTQIDKQKSNPSQVDRRTMSMSPKDSKDQGLRRTQTIQSPRDDTGVTALLRKSTSPKIDKLEKKGMDLATNQNLIEWTYEYFQNRYGLKNVADKKFQQFIGSILKYKDKYPRFRIFGRFLGLYDELSDHDLKLYVDIVANMFKTVLNFQILEQDEVILIPTARALDYFRMTFTQRLTNTSMSQCLKIIRQKQISVNKALQDKNLHLNSYNEAVQLDDFAEFVIHTTNQLQAEKLQNIYDIFMAADLNNNGVLEFNELKTLYKLLCNQHSGDVTSQLTEIRALFNEYSEINTNVKGTEGMKLRAITLDSFENLCLEKDVFTIRQQNSFINAATKSFLNVTDNQETFTVEFERLSANLDSIYERLSGAISDILDSQIVSDNDKIRYQDMIEQMAKAIIKPVNKKIAFLTFKIVEETIKRACLKVQIEKLMPVTQDTLRLMKKAMNANNVGVTDRAAKTVTNMKQTTSNDGTSVARRSFAGGMHNDPDNRSQSKRPYRLGQQQSLDMDSQGGVTSNDRSPMRKTSDLGGVTSTNEEMGQSRQRHIGSKEPHNTVSPGAKNTEMFGTRDRNSQHGTMMEPGSNVTQDFVTTSHKRTPIPILGQVANERSDQTTPDVQ